MGKGEEHANNVVNPPHVDDTVIELSYEDKLKFVSSISKPMASKKLAKKICKLMKKGKCHKTTHVICSLQRLPLIV